MRYVFGDDHSGIAILAADDRNAPPDDKYAVRVQLRLLDRNVARSYSITTTQLLEMGDAITREMAPVTFGEDQPGEPLFTCRGNHTFGRCDRDACDFVRP